MCLIPRPRRRHIRLAAAMALPPDWTVPDLTASVEAVMGYRVVWLALPPDAPIGLCGLEFRRSDDVVVFHRHVATPANLRRVLAHAAAHLLLQHREGYPVVPLAADEIESIDSADGADRSGVNVRMEPSDGRDRLERDADLLAAVLLTGPEQMRAGEIAELDLHAHQCG